MKGKQKLLHYVENVKHHTVARVCVEYVSPHSKVLGSNPARTGLFLSAVCMLHGFPLKTCSSGELVIVIEFASSPLYK